jgi:hypothetical protein
MAIVRQRLQIGHLVFELCAFLFCSRQLTLKLTLKVNKLRGYPFSQGSPFEGTQIQKVIIEIGPFMFALSYSHSSYHYKHTDISITIHTKNVSTDVL